MGHVIQANAVLRNCCGDSDKETFRERVSQQQDLKSQGVVGSRRGMQEGIEGLNGDGKNKSLRGNGRRGMKVWQRSGDIKLGKLDS